MLSHLISAISVPAAPRAGFPPCRGRRPARPWWERCSEPNQANTSVGKDQIHGVQWHRTQVSEAQCYDGEVSTLTQTHTHTDTDTACLTRSVDVVLQRKGDSILHHQAIYLNWNFASNWTDRKFGSSFCEFISTEMFSPALPRSFSVYFFKLYHKLKLLKIY